MPRSTFIFYITEPIIVTEYSPDNIFTCLAKIGAFLALGRIFMIVGLYHEYKFEKILKEDKGQPSRVKQAYQAVINTSESSKYKLNLPTSQELDFGEDHHN